jgi:hypothetical protein
VLLAALVMLHQTILLRQTSSLPSFLLDHRDLQHIDSALDSPHAGIATATATADRTPAAAAGPTERTQVPIAQRIDTDWEQQQSSSNSKDTEIEEGDQWLTMHDFDVYLDAFSDSWYMSLATFMDIDAARMKEIEAVEEACFVMYENREEKVRMALDWLDFGVEHMSKWWKVLEAPRDEYPHHRVVRILDQYVQERIRSIRQHDSLSARSLLRPTVALVAFQQYAVRGVQDDALQRRSQELTVASLSATIASLMQAGMGRIVVVGHDQQQESERPLVHEAFSRFAPDQAYGTQLAYVTVSDDMVKTDFMSVNVPRGALLGLRRALEENDPEWTAQWLGRNATGSTHPWRFVYLTEPDTILHARPSSLAVMERMLEKGMILVPHRLQPVPYEGDVPASNQSHTFISKVQVAASTSPNILELDAADSDAACCDEQMGTLRPGPKAAIAAGLGSQCGWDRWWLCGFGAQQSQQPSNEHNGSHPYRSNHSLILDHYQLIRLRQGTGVTLISGSSHGRRCFPTLRGTCTRKMRPPTQEAPVRPTNPWITPKRLQERRAMNQNATVATAT